MDCLGSYFWRFVGVFLFNFLLLSNAFASVDASIKTNRTEGVAPLVVFFDASETTSTISNKPFHDLHYKWDFGDPESGRWNHSGKLKNQSFGPVTAHVFDKPGVYHVLLTVTDKDGNSDTEQLTIDVINSDKFFARANTTCFSNTDDFSGCPRNAKKITTDDFYTVMQHTAPEKRLLLRRGDKWSVSRSSLLNIPGPGIIGAFGKGDKPVVESYIDEPVIRLSSGRDPQFNDWRIMDLEFMGANEPATLSGNLVVGDNTVKELLIYRIKASNFHAGILLPASTIKHYGSQLHSNIAIVESDITNMKGGQGGYCLYAGVENLMVLGNKMADSVDAEHIVRTPLMRGGVISHNYLANPAERKHVIKIHSLKDDEKSVLQGQRTEKFIVADNIIRGANNDWTVAVGPQNAQSNENVRTGIIERNYFIAGSGTRVHLMIWASDIQVRNNILNMTGAKAFQGVVVTHRGVELAPIRNRIYNNTCYTADVDANRVSCVQIGSVAEDSLVMNNLLATPFSIGNVVVDNGQRSAVRNNMLTDEQVFSFLKPTKPEHFCLHSASEAINAGTEVSVYGDFDGSPSYCGKDIECQRGIARSDGLWDIGAYESSDNVLGNQPHFIEKSLLH